MDSITNYSTYLGIDYGETHIGLALGRNGYVTPLRVIQGKHVMTAIHEIVRIAMENKIDKYVVGLPLDDRGKETRQSIATRKFGNLLKIYAKRPIIYFDENNSTMEAPSQSIVFGHTHSKKFPNDHVAAAIILKRFFESSPLPSV